MNKGVTIGAYQVLIVTPFNLGNLLGDKKNLNKVKTQSVSI